MNGSSENDDYMQRGCQWLVETGWLAAFPTTTTAADLLASFVVSWNLS